jgi:hypothetical protein
MNIPASQMSHADAKACVNEIRKHINAAGELLLDLHDRAGWKALGYKSFAACVHKEFNMSRSAVYARLAAIRVKLEMASMDVRFSDMQAIPDSHARALAAIPPEDRIPIYDALNALDERPTGQDCLDRMREFLCHPAMRNGSAAAFACLAEVQDEVLRQTEAALPLPPPPIDMRPKHHSSILSCDDVKSAVAFIRSLIEEADSDQLERMAEHVASLADAVRERQWRLRVQAAEDE